MGSKMLMQDGEIFAEYIKSLWEKQGLSMQAVCSGLCTVQEFHYLMTGERMVSWILREAVLERLGVGAEDFEYLLSRSDYRRWEKRHHILHCITYGQFREGEMLLEEYRLEYKIAAGLESTAGNCGQADKSGAEINTNNRLEAQFYISMLAQLRRCQGASEEELFRLFDSALRLTVPDYEVNLLPAAALSFKELNLMLEAERYRREGERPERYLEIVRYIDGRKFHRRGKGKIYPKAVCFLCRCAVDRQKLEKSMPENTLMLLSGTDGPDSGTEWTSAGLLQYCECALELLREIGRMYYLWEILSVRGELLDCLAQEALCWQKQSRGLFARLISLEPLQRENREWKEMLEKTYVEFGVPKETFEYCYMYVAKGGVCINDVLRIRRNMLGISPREFCRGICDVSTLRRLEKGTAKPQRFIAQALLERMGLSGELARTELATSSPEAKEMMERIKDAANNRYWDEMEKLLLPLKGMVTVQERCNRQVFMRKEATLFWRRGEIDREEYCRRMRAALEITLPYEAFLKEGEKYLTHEEQRCIQNRMLGMEENSEEYLTCMRRFEEIYSFYEENDLLETVAGMHDLIMGYVGRAWGRRGDYDRADKYCGIIIQGCLRLRRLSALYGNLYDRLWNNRKRIEEGLPAGQVLDAETELERCILLCEIDRSDDRHYYEKKRNAVRAGKGAN